MRRGARHRSARQRQPVEQSARRPCRGRDLFAGPARRHLHIYGRTADLGRACAGGGAAQAGQAIQEGGEEETAAGSDLIIAFSHEVDAGSDEENASNKKASQPVAPSYCELASSHCSSARANAPAAAARALLSWAACFGSRVNRSGSASAVSIFSMMPLMRAISVSASEICCFSDLPPLERCGLSRSALRSLPARSREAVRIPRADSTMRR